MFPNQVSIAVLWVCCAWMVGCASQPVPEGFERIRTSWGSLLAPHSSQFDMDTKKAAASGIFMGQLGISTKRFGVMKIEPVTTTHEKWFVKRSDDTSAIYDVYTDGENIKVTWYLPDHPHIMNEVEFEIER